MVKSQIKRHLLGINNHLMQFFTAYETEFLHLLDILTQSIKIQGLQIPLNFKLFLA